MTFINLILRATKLVQSKYNQNSTQIDFDISFSFDQFDKFFHIINSIADSLNTLESNIKPKFKFG